jgi:hypothetical protein
MSKKGHDTGKRQKDRRRLRKLKRKQLHEEWIKKLKNPIQKVN